MISLKCNMVVILFVVLKWFDKTRDAHSDSLHTVSTNFPIQRHLEHLEMMLPAGNMQQGGENFNKRKIYIKS